MNDHASESTSVAIEPSSTQEVAEAVRAHQKIVPVGNRTKPLLCKGNNATILSTKNLQGIIEYEASEFTFTARAGTTIREIQTVLAAKNQYLPFDPPLVDSGATIGGTVAAGLSGSGRFRYGGIRDFLLGVRFVSGDGAVIQSGGKVVKNAAGFDIPKLLVGSLGRLGVMTELTFKVFPKPPQSLTACIVLETHADAFDAMTKLARSRFELDAIDYRSDEKTMYFRLRAEDAASRDMANKIGELAGKSIGVLDEDVASLFWSSVRELAWHSADATLIKVPHSPPQAIQLADWCDGQQGCSVHMMSAGTTSWISVSADAINELHQELCKLEIAALAVRGPGDRAFWGYREPQGIYERIRHAMDPDGKFNV